MSSPCLRKHQGAQLLGDMVRGHSALPQTDICLVVTEPLTLAVTVSVPCGEPVRVVQKKARFLRCFIYTIVRTPPLQAQQLHLSEASLQMQPWEHFAQPTGQQEQQLFLQEVHLHCLHLQEPAQEQDPSRGRRQGAR